MAHHDIDKECRILLETDKLTEENVGTFPISMTVYLHEYQEITSEANLTLTISCKVYEHNWTLPPEDLVVFVHDNHTTDSI